MITDARELPEGHRLEADVCVVGGGAAGISLALRLSGTGCAVTLLESGGIEFTEETQALYDGTSDGELLEPGYRYLSRSRWRYLSGATNAWSGLCLPLDPSDFEARDWVADSGWPITAADLELHYREAERLLQVEPFDRATDLESTPPCRCRRSSSGATTSVESSSDARIGTRLPRRQTSAWCCTPPLRAWRRTPRVGGFAWSESRP